MKPTPDEIEAALSAMRKPGTRAGKEWDGRSTLWWVVALDPHGEERGHGSDLAFADARVAAWIVAHDDVYCEGVSTKVASTEDNRAAFAADAAKSKLDRCRFRQAT